MAPKRNYKRSASGRAICVVKLRIGDTYGDLNKDSNGPDNPMRFKVVKDIQVFDKGQTIVIKSGGYSAHCNRKDMVWLYPSLPEQDNGSAKN